MRDMALHKKSFRTEIKFNAEAQSVTIETFAPKEFLQDCNVWKGERVARPRGTDQARVIQVIETTALRGKGTEEDKCRKIKQYWDFDGNFLAEFDPCTKEKE